MRQFFNSSTAAFTHLEDRCRRSCVIFQDQEMPPGTTPDRLRVGFEVYAATGMAALLVDHGASYVGPDAGIRRWLDDGEMRFPSFTSLCSWIDRVLKPAYDTSENTLVPPKVNRLTQMVDATQVQTAALVRQSRVTVDPVQPYRKLAEEIRGQEIPLKRLSFRVCSHLARTKPRRPMTILALGPTGVGKTKTVEHLPVALRELEEGNEDFHYLRLDMSEYQERHRVSQLFGSPQGYVGYGDGAQLVDTLAAHPKSIVLFDEIEKAHPDILRSVMNLMDSGRISSATNTRSGREIDCRQATLFFTSNVRSDPILSEIGSRRASKNDFLADEICRKHLRESGVAPEIVGRIGCFLVYHPLSDIARMEILALSIVRVAEEYGVTVSSIKPEAMNTLIRLVGGNDFGARPDEYVISELLGSSFANAFTQFGEMPLRLAGGNDANGFFLEPMAN